MEEEEMKNDVNELRLKRLAYYESLNKHPSDEPTEHNGHIETSTDKLQEKAEDRKQTQRIIDSEETRARLSKKKINLPEHHNIQGNSSDKDFNFKSNLSESSEKLKTSEFHFQNPDVHSNKKQPESFAKLENEISKRCSAVYTAKYADAKSDDLDPYNETVERLIRATKEEMLGMTVSDDIWSKIKEDSKQFSNSLDKETEENDHTTFETKPTLEIAKATKAFEQSCVEYENKNLVEYSEEKHLSHNENFSNEQSHRSIVRSISEDVGQRNGAVLFEMEKTSLRQHRSSFSGAVDMHPEPSKLEPHVHRKVDDHQEGHLKHSYNSAKVEEMFHSVQVSCQKDNQSWKNPHVQGYEKKPLLVEASEDFSALGLETHRPENEKEQIDVQAEDINLGYTVSKELRTVLGDDKFKEFLIKAKRDIDVLNDKSAENSSRTPRLIKDKPRKPETSHGKDIKESRTPRQARDRHDSKEGKNKIEKRMPAESAKPESLLQLCNSQDFTPRLQDAEAIENILGEYVLGNHGDKSKESTVNPDYNSKNFEKNLEMMDEKSKQESGIVIPTLDLEEVKDDSPRRKLNRPKHQPPTIYQEKKGKDHKGSGRVASGDSRTRQGKNYEQITVPRNVAFSADEIYSQAYGASFSEHSGILSPEAKHGNFEFENVPQTPTTPIRQPLMPHQDTTSFRGHYGQDDVNFGYYHAVRQQYQAGNIRPPHPPPYQGHVPQQAPSNHVYSSSPDYSGYGVNATIYSSLAATQNHGVQMPYHQQGQGIMYTHPQTTVQSSQVHEVTKPSSQMSNEIVAVPHPPSKPRSLQGVHNAVHPSVHAPVSMTNEGHGHIQFPMATKGQGYIPVSMTADVHLATQMAVPNSLHTKEHFRVQNQNDLDHVIPVSKATQTGEFSRVPITSDAEMQTDRGDSPVVDDKVTMVEESTFTSVSQIVQEEPLVPHPPSVEKDGRPSPRRYHGVTVAATRAEDSRRHIDGIRHHHEQRRQQHDGEKQSEDQIVEHQKRFAKASIERYFSSLENIYMPADQAHPSSISSCIPEIANDMELESLTSGRLGKSPDERGPEQDEVIDDVIRKTVSENFMDTSTVVSETKYKEQTVRFNPVVHGFADFTEEGIKPSVEQKPLKQEENDDSQTLVNSVVNTDVTVNGGGLTDRLHDLGIDVAHVIHGDDKDSESKKAKNKGKVLIVCPECQGLNKEYMSWCTHCGEMIIGIEPMLVSKNREGKIRTKPLNKSDLSHKIEDIVIKDPHAQPLNSSTQLSNEIEVNYVQDTSEKPFALNLEELKTDKEEEEMKQSKKCSPIKSDGKDSGRPSSDDHDLEVQAQKIEEEVVNDICATISDPVLLGYVRSQFNNFKKSGKEFTDGIKDNGISENRLDIELFLQNKIAQEKRNKPSKEVKSSVQKHDTVQMPVQGDDDTEQITKGIVKDKIALFNTGGVKPEIEHWDDNTLLPPRLPNFSANLPIKHGELSLKLPANSMDYSTDVSQVVSQSFKVVENLEQTATVAGHSHVTEEEAKTLKQERRRQRRLKRGHGAIDVEVFGYEESRESRNSSRANRMVPLLNLAGNSSDEDDSVYSDFKSDTKQEPVEFGYQHHNKTTTGAWDQPVIPEEPETTEQLSGPLETDEPDTSARPILLGTKTKQHDDTSNTDAMSNQQQQVRLNQMLNKPGTEADHPSRPDKGPLEDTTSSCGHGQESSARAEGGTEEGGEWKTLFQPQTMEAHDDAIEEDTSPSPEASGQPFLMQILNQPKPTKSRQRPKSAGKPVKSKVRQSLEEAGYQRKWGRSSTAWNSYNAGELNTSSSLRSSADFPRRRPFSAPKSRAQVSSDMQASEGMDDQQATADPERHEPPERLWGASRNRPISADVQTRKHTKKKSKKGGVMDSLDLDLDVEMIEHRLPKPSLIDRLQDHMASPASTYDKYLQMTPRIEAGTVSRWQCLPDEILLHIFAYLDQSSLTRVAHVCHQFYRVAMDETLWKYITIKKGQLTDQHLSEIAERHPVSLALIQCHGDSVTARGLRDLFRDCAATLKELNIARCSGGALSGDSLLLHAAARCHNLTHIDCSWCNVTDSGLMAISNCAHRLESLCMNGCQAVSNDGLETIIKKHGAHLRVLEMFACFNLSPRGLRSVANNCINLITLNLGQCYKLTDSCISQLSTSLGRVESLDLRGCKQIKDNCIRRVVKNCPRLKHLSIANCLNITDVSLLEISTYLTDIRSVDVCGCKHISDGSVRALVNTCTNLRHLDISSTNCTHRSVSMIANFCGQRLESLKINFLSDVTEQSLVKLARHCRRLKSVHLYGCTSVRNVEKINEERPTFTLEM
ncbi:uncharacterized protein LOC128231710 isoform X2 [Mya arenaria]|uniref:uncharacterized protein LOC128231710 isoform X2 n=1 Tax=Mya arenaria TaxID=6604 RepID=UPI0022DF56B5|nr:uncharacterized protein LOC128231710 isoform X2 [Mya arenaria]